MKLDTYCSIFVGKFWQGFPFRVLDMDVVKGECLLDVAHSLGHDSWATRLQHLGEVKLGSQEETHRPDPLLGRENIDLIHWCLNEIAKILQTFSNAYLQWKSLHFDLTFTKVCSYKSNLHEINIVLGAIRQQAIWNNLDEDPTRCHMVSLRRPQWKSNCISRVKWLFP